MDPTFQTTALLWTAAGWTMMHLLSVGAVIGLMAALGRRLLKQARPELRYGVALACLVALGVSPGAIFVWLYEPVSPADVALIRPVENRKPAGSDATAIANRRHAQWPEFLGRSLDRPAGNSMRWSLDSVVAYLPWFWLTGSFSTLVMLATGLIGIEQLRRSSRLVEVGELPRRCRLLADSLGIARRVSIGICDRLAAPLLLGIVRPLILLPPAALSGWSVEQLEMVLLHELAHLRRWDNLVNLLQRVLESLLFFHPVVWWLSGWVRLERELCCDRLVVERLGHPFAYAEMLVALSGSSRPGRGAVLAMADRQVMTRIRRLFNLEERSMKLTMPEGLGLLGVVIVGTSLVVGSQAAPLRQVAAPDEMSRQVPKNAVDDVPAIAVPVAQPGKAAEPTSPAAPRDVPAPDSLQSQVMGKALIIKIEIEGNVAIPSEKIKSKLLSQVGKPLNQDRIETDIKSLMGAKWFSDVRYHLDESPPKSGKYTLTWVVREVPFLTKVEFRGRKAVPLKEIEDATGLKVGNRADRVRTWLSLSQIQRLYQQKGYFFADVRLLEGGNPDDTNIIISIFEGPRWGSDRFEGVVTSVNESVAHSDQHVGTALDHVLDGSKLAVPSGKSTGLAADPVRPTGPKDDPVSNSPKVPAAGEAPDSTPAPTLSNLPASQRETFLFPRSERRVEMRRLAIASDGVETWNCRGITILTKTSTFGIIEIEAEEAIIRRGPKRTELQPKNGETWLDPDDLPMNVSVKGDVILRQFQQGNPGKGEQRIFRATELDYDFVTDRLEARNAEVEVLAPGLLTPIKIKSPKIEQFHPLVRRPNGTLAWAQHREISAGSVSSRPTEAKNRPTTTRVPKFFEFETDGFW